MSFFPILESSIDVFRITKKPTHNSQCLVQVKNDMVLIINISNCNKAVIIFLEEYTNPALFCHMES